MPYGTECCTAKYFQWTIELSHHWFHERLEWESIGCVCGYIGVGEHWLCVWLHWSGRTLTVCVVTLEWENIDCVYDYIGVGEH